MSGPTILLDPFVRGIAVGALLVVAFTVWRSRVGRDARLASTFVGVSVAAWIITESAPLWDAFGHAYILVLLAYPVSGLFWLFIRVVFEDRPITPLGLAPAAAILVIGIVRGLVSPDVEGVLWAVSNVAGGLLSLHAVFIIAQGWRGDLLEGRRRLRALLLGAAALFAVLEVVLALANRVTPMGSLMLLTVGEIYGGVIIAVLALAMAALFLQGRAEVFGVSRRTEPQADSRAEAAERLMLQALNAAMAAEGWRREGLTIGDLARELDIPEHRLRRLINKRLGHRNFADFLNSHRIEAAKRRLADPREARTTVAAVAFDLGYGSLGPFNRAFRTATGASPTDWRRQALQASPELDEAV
jgi:AraC-like DNA-binding protein